ncbi:B-box domain protein 31 [Linum perenne]
MKRCELCKSMARTFCESDQASLCWSCDAKVHGANFLVARHSRTLLCHLCQSPTPWQAAGAKLGHTVSFCLRCANGDSRSEEEEEEEEEEMEEEDDFGDNQVVPWASSDSTPPPPAESSSSSSYSSDSDGGESIQSAVSTKRTREGCVDLCSLLQVCLANQYSKFHFISPSKF